MPENTARTVAIIQARMGSTRLPGKILMDLAGEPMLMRVVSRTSRASRLDGILVATTTLPGDDVIEEISRSRGWPFFRGASDDVLDRYYQAARHTGAGIVVRITSDCPFIEPEVINRVVDALAEAPGTDYASNTLPPQTFPRGLDVEAIRFAALERAWREDTRSGWREHVTPYIYRHPEIFQIASVVNDADLSAMRWTVDTSADLEFARRIYAHFGADSFSWREVLALLGCHPDWQGINKDVTQRTVPVS